MTSGTTLEYRQQIEAAKERGDFVAVVSTVRQGERPRYDKGVTYYASEFEARLVEASMLPSERGNDSLLADVLKDAMGNVIGPVAEQSGNVTGSHNRIAQCRQQHQA